MNPNSNMNFFTKQDTNFSLPRSQQNLSSSSPFGTTNQPVSYSRTPTSNSFVSSNQTNFNQNPSVNPFNAQFAPSNNIKNPFSSASIQPTFNSTNPIQNSLTTNPLQNLNANPSNSFANVSNSFTNVSNSFGNPSFGNPSTSFGNPSASFGNPSNSFGNPANSFGNPSTSFGNPSTSFVNPANSFGNPSNSFGNHSTSFPNVSNQFTTPSNLTGNPSNQLTNPFSSISNPIISNPQANNFSTIGGSTPSNSFFVNSSNPGFSAQPFSNPSFFSSGTNYSTNPTNFNGASISNITNYPISASPSTHFEEPGS